MDKEQENSLIVSEEGHFMIYEGEKFEVYQGALKNYRILGEIFPCDQEGTPWDTALEIGSVQEVPVIVGEGWIEKGLAEEVADGTVNADQNAKPEENATQTTSAPESKEIASVFDDRGQFVRNYSLADHGEGYKELANQFIEKNGGKIIHG